MNKNWEKKLKLMKKKHEKLYIITSVNKNTIFSCISILQIKYLAKNSCRNYNS